MTTSLKRPSEWSFINRDTDELLEAPYPIDSSGVRITGGSNFASQERFGFQDPIVQWVSGRQKSITFSTVLFSQDREDDIRASLRKFELLAEYHKDFKRPPICLFSLGTTLAETVVVENVDITITEIRPHDGKPRQVLLDFTLLKYKPFSQVQVDGTRPSKESYYLVTTSAEASYEAIAANYYGDPMYGDRLRKRNPSEPFVPEVGQQVSIPARAIIQSESVEPEFHALNRDNEEAVANFERILDLRNQRTAQI